MGESEPTFNIQVEDDLFKFKNFGSYTNLENLKVIQKECHKLISSVEDDGLVSYILNNINNGVNVLTSGETPIPQTTNLKTLVNTTNLTKLEFLNSLILENVYYTNSVDQLINDEDFEIPLLDNSIATHYLINIIKEKKLIEENIKSSLLRFYIDIIGNKIEDDQVIATLNKIADGLRFPNADEITKNKDQIKISSYLKVLMDHYKGFKKENYTKWEDIIVKVVSKTFQSINAAGLASKFFAIQGGCFTS
ncbi:unnamed protein product [Hanseniaspora opuntiae]